MKAKKYTKPQIEIYKFMEETNLLAGSVANGNMGTGSSKALTDPTDVSPTLAPSGAKAFNNWTED